MQRQAPLSGAQFTLIEVPNGVPTGGGITVAYSSGQWVVPLPRQRIDRQHLLLEPQIQRLFGYWLLQSLQQETTGDLR